MAPRTLAASAVVVTALSLLTAWVLDLSVQRAVILAPAIVIALGLVGMVLAILGRSLVESWRAARHPRRVLAYAVAALGAIAVLAALGVELPRE
jgi:hypothetical protein